MTREATACEPTPELWRDSIWDRLLDSLADRSVIPIVGRDILQVEVDGVTTALDHYIALRLSQIYNLPTDEQPAAQPLNHAVCHLR
jgi:hypothetical protein